MSKVNEAIMAETVAVPLDVARDLIAALSAENARLREELAGSEWREDYHRGESEKYQKMWRMELQVKQRARE